MILCLCQRGNVRSATLASILRDCYGEMNVVATGLQTTDLTHLIFLSSWANGESGGGVFIVGKQALVDLFTVAIPNQPYTHLDVGDDQWGTPMHPDLVEKIIRELERVGYDKDTPRGFYNTTKDYIVANAVAWGR